MKKFSIIIILLNMYCRFFFNTWYREKFGTIERSSL